MITNNRYIVLFLIILLFGCIYLSSYNHTALGNGDNDGNNGNDGNDGNDGNNGNDNDIKEKKEKKKDKGNGDDTPFILPVPFP